MLIVITILITLLFTFFYISTKSGAGGIRTLVQTGKPYAFYMLILVFIFVQQQDPSHQLLPYSLKFHQRHETSR